jgi:uncharacterized membrane protein YeaQ/YmgE (transglycosylase-associated protein family)
MGLENFPITAAMLYTLVGAILFAGLATQWLKKYLGDWRFTGLVCLALAVAFEFAAAWVSQGKMDAEIAFAAVLLGVVGASVATFGYETIVNMLGLIGKGPRSDAGLAATSIAEVKADGSEDDELEKALAVVEAAGFSVCDDEK